MEKEREYWLAQMRIYQDKILKLEEDIKQWKSDVMDLEDRLHTAEAKVKELKKG